MKQHDAHYGKSAQRIDSQNTFFFLNRCSHRKIELKQIKKTKARITDFHPTYLGITSL